LIVIGNLSAVCADGALPVRAGQSPVANGAGDRGQRLSEALPPAEASFFTSLTPCLRSSVFVRSMFSRTSQTGADALKSFWPPTRPEVGNWFDQVKFQEMYFCDVTTTISKHHHARSSAEEDYQ